MTNKKIIWGILVLIVAVALIYLVIPRDSSVGSVQSKPAGDWINMELKNVLTGEDFKISDFEGKPILLESFAVWCPTCTQQQKLTKDLHDEVGDSIISISIDTDPNEDEARVVKHATDNGFNWYYVVAPVDFTRSLIDQFGIDMVNAPAVPMVLVCDDQNARQLSSGLKSVEKLKLEISLGC